MATHSGALPAVGMATAAAPDRSCCPATTRADANGNDGRLQLGCSKQASCPNSQCSTLDHRGCLQEKGPRGFRQRSKSGRKRPGGRAATADVSAIVYLIVQIQGPRALTGGNFLLTIRILRATVRIAADRVGQPVSQPVTGPIGQRVHTDARQCVDDPLDANLGPRQIARESRRRLFGKPDE
jgi:hypothetical protein